MEPPGNGLRETAAHNLEPDGTLATSPRWLGNPSHVRVGPAGEADLVAEIEANRFSELSVSARHAAPAARLPPHHTDPFDRLFVAQSQAEGLVCVTRDPIFQEYGVASLW